MLKGNIKLVAISGAARSGKDTLAQALCGNFGYHQHSFAEPIYKMLNTLPYLEHISSRRSTEEKETPLSFYGKSPRQLLQTLGTEWGRFYVHPDLWIRILEDKLMRKYDFLGHCAFVVSDLRFQNEADWVRSIGGLVVHVEREDVVQVTAHVSESGFPLLAGDRVVYNNSTIEALCQQAGSIDDFAECCRVRAMQSSAA